MPRSEPSRDEAPVPRALGRPPRRILTIRLGAVGDVLTVLPSIFALRRLFPEAEIDHLVDDGSAGVIEGHPALTSTFRFPRAGRGRLCAARALVGELRARRYDVAVDFHGLLKSGLIAALSGARTRVGRAHWQELNPLFTHFHMPVDRGANMVQQHFALLAAFGDLAQIGPPCPSPPPIDEAARQRARAELERLGVRPPFVLVTPGSRWPARALPARRVAEILDALEAHGRASLLAGGPRERDRFAEVTALRGRPTPASTGLDLPALAALVESCQGLVGADSGPMHMADMLKKPLVALFGPSSPALYGPLFAPNRVLRDAVGGKEHDFRGRGGGVFFQSVSGAKLVEELDALLSGS